MVKIIMNENILLCDIGGTHARFAKSESVGTYTNFKKYRLNDFSTFNDIVQTYLNDVDTPFSSARFSVARTPMNGRIEYKRHAGDPDYIIDFNVMEDQFQWTDVPYLNDLEAAAHGAKLLQDDQASPVLKTQGDKWNNNKVIISVGTGVGHAGIFNNQVMQTPGGHWLPITVTKEHRELESFVRNKKDPAFDLIMEDFVSGHGLRTIAEFTSGQSNDHLSPSDFMNDLKNNPDTIRLFFELLGLYAHNITNVTGFYGGVYLTGGVIDNLAKNNLTNWNAFEQYFRPDMVSVVNDRLNSTAVSYVSHDELPLLGLTSL